MTIPNKTTPPSQEASGQLEEETKLSLSDSQKQSIELLKKDVVGNVKDFVSQNPAKDINPAYISNLNRELQASYLTLSEDQSPKTYETLMKACDKLLSAKCGIMHYEINGGPNPLGMQIGHSLNTKITIKDARLNNESNPEEFPESWMQSIIAQARGTSSLFDMQADSVKNQNAKKAIAKTCETYCQKLQADNLSPQKRKKIVDEFSTEMLQSVRSNDFLEIGGKKLNLIHDDSELLKILNDARDFCNFNETQNHIVTITSPVDGKNVMLASMKMTPISESLRKEYEAIKNEDTLPVWFENMPIYQQALTKKYIDQIIDGEHAIPTQLRYLPGLKNSYLDIRGLINKNNIEDVYAEAHSGSMVHDVGTKMDDEVTRLTKLTMDHAANLVGGTESLVLSVLNSNSIANTIDRNICKITEKIAEGNRVEYHQNGVNLVALNPKASIERISKLHEEITEKKQKTIWTMCKSGKDRTFALMIKTTAEHFAKGSEPEFDNVIKYGKVIGKSGHAETMSSGAGATRGAYGLKLTEFYIRMWDGLKEINFFTPLKSRFKNTICQVNNMQKSYFKPFEYDKIYKEIERGKKQTYRDANSSNQIPSMSPAMIINPLISRGHIRHKIISSNQESDGFIQKNPNPEIIKAYNHLATITGPLLMMKENKKIQDKFSHLFQPINWKETLSNPLEKKRTTNIGGNDLSEISQKITLNGQITTCRSINFTPELKEGSPVPIHLSIALQDQDGLNMKKSESLYFTVHYDSKGKLEEMTYPRSMKFDKQTGQGFIEIDKKIFTLPINENTFKEMNLALEKNKKFNKTLTPQKQTHKSLQEILKEQSQKTIVRHHLSPRTPAKGHKRGSPSIGA